MKMKMQNIVVVMLVCSVVPSSIVLAQRPGPHPTPHPTPIDARPGRLPYYDREWDRHRADAERDRIKGPKPVRNAVALERLSRELFVLTLMVNPVDRKGILKRAAAIQKQAREIWAALPNQAEAWEVASKDTTETATATRRPAYAAQELQSYARGITDDVAVDAKATTPDSSLRAQILSGLQTIVRLAREVEAGYAQRK